MNTYTAPKTAAGKIRRAIERGQEQYWRQQDFPRLPAAAVSQALSRMAREGFINRVAKGIYYRPRPTTFGNSRPSPTAIQNLDREKKAVFPAGLQAANVLGFSTQNVMNGEYATPASSLPSRITGTKARIHTRRPEAWKGLSETDAAILDFIRQRGRTSELPPRQTVQRLLELIQHQDRYCHLARVAMTEPPRVRAMLGTIGQELGVDPRILDELRRSLNPLSRFDFGLLSSLEFAREWQAERPGAQQNTNEAL